MLLTNAIVIKCEEVKSHIFRLILKSPDVASIAKPGQFINLKVSENTFPLLRRPFSISDCDGDTISILFNIFGEGTKMLSHYKNGDSISIIGPLGNGFSDDPEIKNALFVAGGMGIAPFPFLQKNFVGKNIYTFIGGRSENEIIEFELPNRFISTEDGSFGLKGNVIQLFEENIDKIIKDNVKVYGCGPKAMLRALKSFCVEKGIECEVSTECAMACGFGICQGCPTESAKHPDSYLLVCKDGPVFNVNDINI